MANKSSKSTTKKSSTVWSLNKVSMWILVAAALLYVIAMILSLVDVNFVVVTALQNIAMAVMVVIVSILAALCSQQRNGLESSLCALLAACYCRHNRSIMRIKILE